MLDAGSFSDEAVVAATRDFVRVRIDCTASSLLGDEDFSVAPAARGPMDRYGVTGWPTVIVADADADGIPVDRFVGVRASADVMRFLGESRGRWRARRAVMRFIEERAAERADPANARRAADDLAAVEQALRRATGAVASRVAARPERRADAEVEVRAHEAVEGGDWTLEFGCVNETFLAFRWTEGPRPASIELRDADDRALRIAPPERGIWRSVEPDGELGAVTRVRLSRR